MGSLSQHCHLQSLAGIVPRNWLTLWLGWQEKAFLVVWHVINDQNDLNKLYFKLCVSGFGNLTCRSVGKKEKQGCFFFVGEKIPVGFSLMALLE